MARAILVYGATGRAGRLVVERALADGWAVTAFVRNPDKLPAALRANITVVTGNLSDGAAVSAAVRSCRPDAIVDASSALPFGHAKGQPRNDADRAVLTRATVSALEADGRLSACVLLILGGQLVREPGGSIDALGVATMAWLLRTVFMRALVREAEGLVRWCFEGAPPELRFVYARLGQMVLAPSRGPLRAEPAANNIQHGSASYGDVADAFVRLAGDPARTWERQAIYFNYAR